MTWLLYVGGALLVLFAVIVIVGIVHLRQSQRQAAEAIAKVELADIDKLAVECVTVFRDKLGLHLDMDNWETAAGTLDEAYRQEARLKGAFARPDLYWYFVLPVGAFLGELVRRHSGHEWVKEPHQAPLLRKVLPPDGQSELWPFDKAIKLASGPADKGDLVAYVIFAREVETAARELERDDDA
jgi:hypothetical protein